MARRLTIEEYEDRFWSRVERRAPSECWPWRDGKFVLRGYGSCMLPRCLLSAGGPKRSKTASNVAWALANRAVPRSGVHVCHECDNPPCCNPAHLWLGTARDNAVDAYEKGIIVTPSTRPGHVPHNKKKLRCCRGHEFTPENTLSSGKDRKCRECHRTWRKRFLAAKNGAIS